MITLPNEWVYQVIHLRNQHDRTVAIFLGGIYFGASASWEQSQEAASISYTDLVLATDLPEFVLRASVQRLEEQGFLHVEPSEDLHVLTFHVTTPHKANKE